MKTYTVAQAFEVLKDYKITTQEESVRRWLRQGTIQGIPPRSRKEGWLIPGDNLFAFIQSRMPGHMAFHKINTTKDISHEKEIRLCQAFLDVAFIPVISATLFCTLVQLPRYRLLPRVVR